MKGGYYLCDFSNEEYLMPMVTKILKSSKKKNSEKFMELRKKLIEMYKTTTEIHVKYGILMVINFLIEYELYLVTFGAIIDDYEITEKKGYEGNYVVINDNPAVNLPTVNYDIIKGNNIDNLIWTDPHYQNIPPYRNYKIILRLLTDDITLIPLYFCEEMDSFFNKMIESFVENYADEVAPTATNDESTRRIVKKALLNRIFEGEDFLSFEKVKPNWYTDLPDFGGIKERITNALIKTLKEITTLQTIYVADGIGFFSWLFMFNERNMKSAYYGSCITFTLVELYFLTRLRIPQEDLEIGLEAAPGSALHGHAYWEKTQDYLRSFLQGKGRHINGGNAPNATGISHWTSIFTYSLEGQKIRKKFRSAKRDYIEYSGIKLNDNPKEAFIATIYPIIDSYIALWEQNISTIGKARELETKVIRKFDHIIGDL